jgi:mRNA-degrading endonuclease RelE of RelBE toxin-antitoxin system
VYEVYVERTAESDLKRLPTNTFQRIIFQIRTLAENPRPSGCASLPVQRTIGELELEIIVSFTRWMKEQRP